MTYTAPTDDLSKATPEPAINPETAPFWEATNAGKLMLRRCPACSAVVWYPRTICPVCGAPETEWFEASGQGSVYSYTVNHKGEGPYAPVSPYVLAYVELDEGPRMMTNIVGVPPSEVSVGQRVRVVFHDTGTGSALPRFTPVGA
jgi:uncharacterized OB-fold protein